MDLNAAGGRDKQDGDEALRRVLTLAEEGSWSEAADQLRSALAESPDDPTLLCWLGVAEFELGAEAVAYERFRRALAAEPTDPVLLATAGAALARIDDPVAESALRSAALLGPDVPVARLQYGAYLVREGMYDDAMVELTAAHELDPDDSDVLRELGTLFALTGRRDQATESYEAAILREPGDSQSHMLLGLELLEQDADEAAAASLIEGARHSPEDVGAQLLAALASHRAGLADPAAEFVERARLVALENEVEAVEDVEEAVGGDDEEARELLLDLATGELRRRRAERP